METPSSSPASAAEQFRMIDVGAKVATRRCALAEGTIYLSAQVFDLVRDKALPKGDALALAEVAGVMAAKNTALLIPLCHPLPIESVRIRCHLLPGERSVRVEAEVRTTGKTGVEMEALAAVQAALLTIYDLCKGTDPALKMGEILLLRKEGGKSGLWLHPDRNEAKPQLPHPAAKLAACKLSIITISDRCFAGRADDTSGAWLAAWAAEQGAELAHRVLVADEIAAIRSAVREAAELSDLVICTGGTGLSPRDVTPEALLPILDKTLTGFGELLRSSGARHNPLAYLSRSFAGLLAETLIVALPGSRKAVAEGMEALLPLLPHALHTMKGGGH